MTNIFENELKQIGKKMNDILLNLDLYGGI